LTLILLAAVTGTAACAYRLPPQLQETVKLRLVAPSLDRYRLRVQETDYAVAPDGSANVTVYTSYHRCRVYLLGIVRVGGQPNTAAQKSIAVMSGNTPVRRMSPRGLLALPVTRDGVRELRVDR
jgi:hypothetical protein